MDRYQKVEKPRPEEPIHENEIPITSQGLVRNYLSYATGLLQVTPGSPADRAGFHPGDVVVEFDGRPVGSIKEVIEIMGDKVGKPLKAVVKRANDSSATLTVIPEEANPDM